ncbi:MAG: amidase [Acidimicrobiia bacterium]|nr:amidase [Acidimicrobiia bacterium]
MDLGVPGEPGRDLGVIDADLERVATGQASTAELVSEALSRARRSQLTTNAFTQLPETSTVGSGPLSGIAVAVKDLIDQASLATTAGSSFLREPASSTAPCLRNLEAAGVTLLGRTNLHEFAFGFSSENDWFGPVRNPLDPATSAGGSSGGSAAAVAAGVVPAAIGTDTGGSVRVPAALCGVVGLKVTHGSIDTSGVFPLAPSLDTVGPIAASVADASIIHAALTGSASLTAPEPAPISGVRVGVPHPWVTGPTTPEVREAFVDALDHMADLGARITEIDLADLEPPGLISPGANFEVAGIHRGWFESDPSRYGPQIRDRLAAALAVSPAEHAESLRWRAASRSTAASAFQDVDVLATPTVGAMTKRIGEDMIDVGGTSLHYRTVLSHFTALVNHLGLPALALPLKAPGLPPPSLQLIGGAGSERRLLAIGLALERAEIAATGDRAA